MYSKYFLQSRYKYVLLIQSLEIVLIVIMFSAAMHGANRLLYNEPHPFGYYRCLLLYVASLSIGLILLASQKYFNFFDRSFSKGLGKGAKVVFLLNIVIITLLYFTKISGVTPYYFLVIGGLQFVSLISVKACTDLFKEKIFRNRTTLIIGEETEKTTLVDGVKEHTQGKILFIGEQERRLKNFMDLADEVYLMVPATSEKKSEILAYCELHDIPVFMIPESHEIALRDATMTQVGDIPLFAVERFQWTEAQGIVKRLMDILLSVLGILLTSPILLVAAFFIRREDGGPVFYRQERSGFHQRPFQMIKLRSMIVDAERFTGEVLAQKEDPRITKVGRIIRATRIDEIPQFFNVFLGHMSIVGPRPERPCFVREFLKEYPDYLHRFAVKPGITGLAQVQSNYTTTPENKLKFDLVYIKRYSPLLDLEILLKTVGVVFRKERSQGVVKPQEDAPCTEDRTEIVKIQNATKKNKVRRGYSLRKTLAIALCSLILVASSVLLRYTTLAVAAIEAISTSMEPVPLETEEFVISDDLQVPLASVDDTVILSLSDINARLRDIGSGKKLEIITVLLVHLSRQELVAVERMMEDGFTEQELFYLQQLLKEHLTQDQWERLVKISVDQH